jgi:poly(hydroxyalkanoate) depolymerase family esterase
MMEERSMNRMAKISLVAILLTLSFTASAAWKQEAVGGFSTVHIYTPVNSQSPIGKGRSLMVVLHGCAQGSVEFKTAKLEAAAEEYGMVIALPEAQYKEGFSCWGYWNATKSRTYNDYKNLIGLATALKERSDLDIDSRQVYIAGLSSGGAFAMQTGCLAPDIFAGMGLVGAPSAGTSSNGAFSLESNPAQTAQRCESFAGTYASHFETQITVSANGTSDYTVPMGYGAQNAKAMSLVYGFNETADSAATSIEEGKAKETLYAQNRVSHLELTGEGHAWPGGTGASGGFIGSASINYALYLGEFFAQNNLRVESSGDDGGDADLRPIMGTVDVNSSNISRVTVAGDITLEPLTQIDTITVEVNGTSYPAFVRYAGGSNYEYNAWFTLENDAKYTFTVVAQVMDFNGAFHTARQNATLTLGTPAEPPSWCQYIEEGSYQYLPDCLIDSTGTVLASGFDAADDEIGDGSDDQIGDGSDDQIGDGSDDQIGDGSDDQIGDGSDDQIGDGSDDQIGDGSDDQIGDGSDDQIGDGSDDDGGSVIVEIIDDDGNSDQYEISVGANGLSVLIMGLVLVMVRRRRRA